MTPVAFKTASHTKAGEIPSLYRSIFERASDAIAIIAPDGTYVEQNESHARLTGWSTSELKGRSPAIHLGQETFERVLRHLQRDDRFIGEVESRHRDGSVRVVELSSFAVRDESGAVVAYVGAKRDVSQRHAADRALRHSYDQLQAIYRLTAALVRTADLESIFREGLDCLTAVLNTRRASVLLLDGEGVMRFRDWRNLSDEYRRAVDGHSPWAPDEPSPKAFVMGDIAADDSLGELRETILEEGIAAAAFVPIVYQGALLGKFMVYFDRPHEMADDDLQLTETVAGHIAFAIARQRADEALARREREFETLAEHAPDIIVRFDRQLRHLYVNPVVEMATGMPPSAFIGRTSAEIGSPPELVDRWETLLRQVFTSGEPAETVFKFDTPAGMRYFHSRAKPEVTTEDGVQTVLCTSRDVTGLKKAERRQRLLAEVAAALARELGYRDALDEVARLVIDWFADGCAIDLAKPDGSLDRLAVANRDAAHTAVITELERRYPTPLDSAAGHVTAYRTGEAQLYSEFPDELLRAASQDDAHFELWKKLEMSSVICAPLIARSRTIGVITLVMHHPSAPFDSDDLDFARQLAGHVAIAVDNLRLYEASQTANQTKSNFMATMSHELRTPLNAIMGYTELLEMRVAGQLTDGQCTQLGRIRSSAVHLLNVIEEILTFSRAEAGKEEMHWEAVDVLELARAAAAMVEPPAVEKGVIFAADVPAGALILETDAVKLRQVLLNLLSNGVKFTSEGSVTLAVRYDADEVVFAVADTGIGIAAEHFERIFEPFWQAESGATRRIGGTGLGLAVCRQLVELLGAELEVASQPDEGSVFALRLRRRGPGSVRDSR
ncbi:hypothetical protein BH23GEM9_BH23GEM9_20890 [soil metagenome]